MNLFKPSTWFAPQHKDRSFDDILRLMFSKMQASGENVTPMNALRCTTVHAIVRALTNAIGSYPVMVYRETQRGDGKTTIEPLPNHNVLRLLKRPNRALTQTQYMRRVVTHLCLWGNALSIKGQGQTGPIRALRPVLPGHVEVLEDDPLNPRYRITFAEGAQRIFSQRQVHHVSGGISLDSIWAESPVEQCSEAIGLCLAAERLLAELYGNGAIPATLLTGGKWANKEQYDQWVGSFKNAYGRGAERGGVGMLPDGMDVKQLNFSPIDAQLLEARKFQRTEIASVYGVPPHKLADLERATFSNIEQQGLEFVQDVALPYVKLIEQAMERDLLTDSDVNAGVVIRFDLDAAERADFKSRVEGYSKLHSVGAISPNEIRAREGMNPRTDPGGDEFVVALNMGSTSDDDEDDTSNDPGDAADDADEPGDAPAISAVS